MKVLITGASSGIGRDLARVLINKSTEMVLVARDLDKLNNLKQELNKESDIEIKTISLDLSIPENCVKLYEENKDIDLMINNAGFGDCGFFTKTNLEKELKMINTNVTAYHILTKLYLTNMKENNKGHILNVASIAGFMPGPLMATYYATKGYVVRLSEGIREELKKEKSNVKISVLCPGPVDTNFDKVANVKFSLKSLSSYEVAEYTIKHLDRFYIIPGTGTKFAKFFSHVLPSSLMSKFIYRIQRRKVER